MDVPTIKKKVNFIRANAEQLVILRAAFDKNTSVVGQDKQLAEKTGLPIKWISSWFGRQRRMLRPHIASSDPISSDGVANIKFELQESVVPLSSSPIVAKTLDSTDLLPEEPPKRKRRTLNTKIKNAPVSDAAVKKTGRPVKVEECSVVLPISRAAPPPKKAKLYREILPKTKKTDGRPKVNNPLSANLGNLDTSATISTDFITLEASSTRSERLYAPLSGSDSRPPSANNVSEKSKLPAVISPEQRSRYGQKVSFHTRFQNQGPSDYMPTNIESFSGCGSTNPSAPVSAPMFLTLSNETFYNQHVPFQDMINHVSSNENIVPAPSAFSTDHIAYYPMGGQNSHDVFPVSEHTTSICTTTVDYQPIINSHHEASVSSQFRTFEPQLQISPFSEDYIAITPHSMVEPHEAAIPAQPLPTLNFDYDCTAITPLTLDPSLAPLKYLPELLQPFRVEDGSYPGLTLENDAFVNCLLDEDLVRREPFQAAMGLVVLSQLGLEWDYL